MTDLQRLQQAMGRGDVVDMAKILNILPTPQPLENQLAEVCDGWERLYKRAHDQREIYSAALLRIAEMDPEGYDCHIDCDCIGCVARQALRKGCEL